MCGHYPGSGAVPIDRVRRGLAERCDTQPEACAVAWMDSLTGERGHCATVVRDLEPAEALRRLALAGDAVTRGTWTQLSACRDRHPAGAGRLRSLLPRWA
jgi:hypothetical protein